MKVNLLDKCVLPNKDIVSWRIIDKQVIFLHKNEKSFYELNEVAGFIWQKAVSKNSIKKIIALLSQYYDIDRQVAERDTLACIEDLLNRKILVIR
ncbi:MAG: PqqD family protein [Candidatus Omnitrophica bacterium]|nr:PqqD family protein [Candidatus Omnitrophota bacterium]